MSEDIINGGLIDVTELDLDELLLQIGEPALASALNRILVSSDDAGSYGFGSRI